MSDLAPFNATIKPLVYLERDWNSLCDHGLEKFASWIIRVNGSYYEALKGGTSSGAGTIGYGGADNTGTVDGTSLSAVCQAVADIMGSSGGLVMLKAGAYTLDDTVTVDERQIWTGEGAGTAITADASLNGDMLKCNEDSYVTFRNLRLIGNTQVNNNGIVVNRGYFNRVLDCVVYNVGRAGITLRGTNQAIVENNVVAGAGQGGAAQGIAVEDYLTTTYCYQPKVINNLCYDCTDDGIIVGDAYDPLIQGNTCYNNTAYGIDLAAYSSGMNILGNICYGNQGGIALSTGATESTRVIISGNNCRDNTEQGILLWGSTSYLTVTGNQAVGNGDVGIMVQGSNTGADRMFYTNVSNNITQGNAIGIRLKRAASCIVTGNHCLDSDTAEGIVVEVDADTNYIANNFLASNTTYGIKVADDTCNNNTIINNTFSGNSSGCLQDLGTNTKLATITAPFSAGSVEAPNGFDIDAAAEYAYGYAKLPAHVQEVEWLKIDAFSVVTEADAMNLEIHTNGAADNEQYNTHGYDGTEVASTSTNFAANDVIYWTVTDAGGIRALTGGDSVYVQVLHEDASGANCATDARFRTIEFAYV